MINEDCLAFVDEVNSAATSLHSVLDVLEFSDIEKLDPETLPRIFALMRDILGRLQNEVDGFIEKKGTF